MVHNSKALVKALESFIMDNVTGHRTSFKVSDVKGDRTVFVRFRSLPQGEPATTLCRRFEWALSGRKLVSTRVDEGKVRLGIEQFGTVPQDYEPCGDCGFDHSYEQAEARQAHES